MKPEERTGEKRAGNAENQKSREAEKPKQRQVGSGRNTAELQKRHQSAESHKSKKQLYISQIKSQYLTVEARKLEHGFRRISAGIPYTLP